MTADRPLRTADFDYDLPAELIAQVPSPRRGESRLLVVSGSAGQPVSGEASPDTAGDRRPLDRQGVAAEDFASETGVTRNELTRRPADPLTRFPADPLTSAFRDRSFSELVALIPAGDLLVLNSTKVRHARFLGTRPSGAPAEVLLIHPASEGNWVALGKPGSALRPGKRIRIGPDALIETIAVQDDGNRVVRFVGLEAEDAISRYGLLPLPPYITRPPDATDEERYQTVFAERPGSVAAPTAGLHFTATMLEELLAKGVIVGHLDLEVGPGTFKPVETEEITSHPMHPERYRIPEALAGAVSAARERGAAIWAVGTTVVRALESAADDQGTLHPGPGQTSLMITPGYNFRVVDRLITNFHLPRSTLLMLVAAFMGIETMRAAYAHAIRQRYRFYSYGDAMVVLK